MFSVSNGPMLSIGIFCNVFCYGKEILHLLMIRDNVCVFMLKMFAFGNYMHDCRGDISLLARPSKVEE